MKAENRIDPAVEEPLRYAFADVIDRDADRARESLSTLSDAQLGVALSYAVHVVGYVVRDVFDHVDEGAALLAGEKIVPDVSTWFADIGTVDEVYSFVRACANEDLERQPADVDSDKLASMAIIIGGYLLGHLHPEGVSWSGYLDQIWNQAEGAAPG